MKQLINKQRSYIRKEGNVIYYGVNLFYDEEDKYQFIPTLLLPSFSSTGGNIEISKKLTINVLNYQFYRYISDNILFEKLREFGFHPLDGNEISEFDEEYCLINCENERELLNLLLADEDFNEYSNHDYENIEYIEGKLDINEYMGQLLSYIRKEGEIISFGVKIFYNIDKNGYAEGIIPSFNQLCYASPQKGGVEEMKRRAISLIRMLIHHYMDESEIGTELTKLGFTSVFGEVIDAHPIEYNLVGTNNEREMIDEKLGPYPYVTFIKGEYDVNNHGIISGKLQ